MQLKDKVVILKSAMETNGEYTLMESISPPGATTTEHYHKIMSQTFEVLKGELNIRIGNKELAFKKGDMYTVPPNTPHLVHNLSERNVKFRMLTKPGLEAYEKFMIVAYEIYPVKYSEEEMKAIYAGSDTYMP